jgi:hypothetical protein
MPATKGPTKTTQFVDWSRGMNRTAARQRMPDNQAFTLENAQPIGPGQLQTTPPPGNPVALIQAHAEIWGVNIKIGGVEVGRLICICLDGTIVEVDPYTPNAAIIAPPGTVTTACRLTTWEDGPVLFGDPTKGYFTWDGTTFLSYPFTFTGDTHTSTTIDNITDTTGLAAGMGLSAADLPPGTEIETVVSTHAITITNAATGSNSSEVITVGAGAPTSVRDLAVFEGRVWLVSALRALTFSAPGSYADFSSASGSGTTSIPDSAFIGSITRILSALELLWIMGPAAVNAISNVQATTVGSPGVVVTTFSDTNIVTNVGTILPSSVASFFRTFLFLSPYGVYAIVGATPQKLSDDLDGLFPDLIFGHDAPAAVFTLNRVFLWAVLVTYNDPMLGPRPVLLTFGRNAWFLLSQGPVTWMTTLVNPATGSPDLWLTNGSLISQAFAGAGANFYDIATKLFDFGSFVTEKQLTRVAVESITGAGTTSPSADLQLYAQSNSGSQLLPISTVRVGTWLTTTGIPGTWLTTMGQPGDWIATGLGIAATSRISFAGNYIGLRLTGTAKPFTLSGLAMEYDQHGEWTIKQ